eukprot:TRINITY_DN356_c0_g1_i3.p1 TRINITY_DN356_c0_g1~~TRINITY_DN356_c0_g1_i3.p1  ORF type:complete len:262 (+),score=37.82 TRINITY_DN356_c0_g1_i3:19-804(+)
MKIWLILFYGKYFKGCIYYLKIAVALGVAAIPVRTSCSYYIVFSSRNSEDGERNAIIRKLPSVETLGCVTVICSDKTGTLTLNEMTVKSFVHFGNSVEDIVECEVTGPAGYNPNGNIQHCDPVFEGKDPGLIDAIRVSTLCNDATIQFSEEEDIYVRHGEPTEAALKCFAEKFKINEVERKRTCHDISDYYKSQTERLAILEFSRGRKSMSVLCRDKKTQQNILLCKGAPEKIIKRCTQVKIRNGNTFNMPRVGRENLLKK